MARISAPVLILQAAANEEPAFTEDAQLWAFKFNTLHRTTRAQVHMIDNVGHFMTLTSPNV
jgi:pimeloyl-ACP methyl ester carboxylesterase